MIKVLISDPDVLAREGIRQMLSSQGGFEVVFDTGDRHATIAGLREHRPDVCVVEISVAKHFGLQFVRHLKQYAGGTPILVINHCHERDMAMRALRAGASGYLSKNCTEQELAAALKSTAAHRPYVSDTVCELLVESLGDERQKRLHDNLSDTDFEIFCLLAEGLPLSKIAALFNLNGSAVRTRRAKIMHQMGFRTDMELVEYALARKLFTDAYCTF